MAEIHRNTLSNLETTINKEGGRESVIRREQQRPAKKKRSLKTEERSGNQIGIVIGKGKKTQGMFEDLKNINNITSKDMSIRLVV